MLLWDGQGRLLQVQLGWSCCSLSHAAQAGSSNAATRFLEVALHSPGETALLWEHGGRRSKDWGRKEWGEEETNERHISLNYRIIRFPQISHGIIGQFWLGVLVYSPCNNQGHLQVDQVAQRPVPLHFEHFQEWGHPSLLWTICSGISSRSLIFSLISTLNQCFFSSKASPILENAQMSPENCSNLKRDESGAAQCQERRHKCPFSQSELYQVFSRKKTLSVHKSSLVRLHMLSHCFRQTSGRTFSYLLCVQPLFNVNVLTRN